jgi:dTDP-4-dehydrorhamnose reductase
MRALVFGSRGLLGRALCRALKTRGVTLFAPTRLECDITRKDHIAHAMDLARPSLVLNAAAYNGVDDAEREPEAARSANVAGPAALARACPPEVPFVHYSSDFVFDGTRHEPYTEEDVPHPVSEYGRSKLDGERAVLDVGGAAIVIRTAWLFGTGGRNFGSTLVQRLASGDELRVDVTRIGSPTWVDALAAQSLLIADSPHRGLFHVVCDGAASWYDVAKFVATSLGRDPTRIVPVRADELGLPARRPDYSVLARARLKALTLDRMPAWQDAMQSHLKEAVA